MSTSERLQSYYPFDHDVLEAVAAAADQQNKQSFTEIAESFDIDNSLVTFVPEGSDKPLQVLTLQPEGDFDETQANVYHTPMGNAATTNMIMRSMRLFAANPTEQLILVGNPSAPGNGAGRLSLKDSRQAHSEHSLRPFVEPLIRQLGAQGVRSVNHLGFSYGADKAATASHVSDDYGIKVRNGVFVEPASVERQNILKLAQRFGSAFPPLERYVEQTGSEPYRQARASENMAAMLLGSVGLLRASNLAIAATLANGGFEHRVRQALAAQPDMRVAIGWGTASELADDQAMTAAVDRMTSDFGGHRIKTPIRLEGMHHAGENDIDLHAAIMLQGLKK
jgi:hypothetical protein